MQAEIDSLKKKRNDIDQELVAQESIIAELDQEIRHQKAEELKSIICEDKYEEVAEVGRGNWRDPGNKSSSSDSEDETESEMDPSKRNTNKLDNFLQTSGDEEMKEDPYELPSK